jgi:hypothetical protein
MQQHAQQQQQQQQQQVRATGHPGEHELAGAAQGDSRAVALHGAPVYGVFC